MRAVVAPLPRFSWSPASVPRPPSRERCLRRSRRDAVHRWRRAAHL